MAGNIKPSSNNMWQTSPVDGLTEPPQLDNIVVNGPTGPTGPTGPAGSGGGGSFTPSGTIAYPVELEPCDWFWVNSNSYVGPYVGKPTMPSWSYVNAPGSSEISGFGDTITADINGSINDYLYSGINPGSIEDAKITGIKHATVAVGHRIGFFDFQVASKEGIYVVTDLGGESTPWILTRATDVDDNDNLGSFPYESNKEYVVRLADTGNFAKSSRFDYALGSQSFATYYGWTVNGGSSSISVGYDSFSGSTALGALGQYSSAIGNYSMAIGTYAQALTDYSIVIGYGAGTGTYGIAPDLGVTIGSQDGSANPISRVIEVTTNSSHGEGSQGSIFVFSGSVTTHTIGANFMQGASMRFLNTTNGNVTITTYPSLYINNTQNGTFVIPSGTVVTAIRLDETHWWIY